MAEENKNQFLSKAGLQTLWRQIAENFDQVYVYELPGKPSDDFSTEELTAMRDSLASAHENDKVVLVNTPTGLVPATRVDYDGDIQVVIEYIDSDHKTLVRYVHTEQYYERAEEDLLETNNVLQQKTPFDLEYVRDNEQTGKPTLFLTVNGERKGSGIDVSDFIADGMLDDTDIITVAEGDTDLIALGYPVGTKLIKFIWKGVVDESGKAKADYIRVSDLAVDPDTSNTEVAEDIIIAGGPLESELKTIFTSKDADGNVIIPKGTSLQDLLVLLACKEMWPTSISTKDGSISSTVANPTITMEKNKATVEVGETVIYKVSNGKSSYSATGHTASGFTYGYSAEDDNSKDSSETSINANYRSPSVASDTSKLTVTAPKNGGGTDTFTENGTSEAGSAIIEGSFNANEGTNTVTAQATSATFQCTFNHLPVYYGCSNTGKTHDGTNKTYKSTAKSETTHTSSSKASGNVTASCTGQYKYFMGCLEATELSELDSTKIRALSKSGWITKDGDTTIVSASSVWQSEGKPIVIACPEKYKLSKITDSMGLDNKPSFMAEGKYGKINVVTGSLSTPYKVYMWVTGGTINLKDIHLAKASSVDEF